MPAVSERDETRENGSPSSAIKGSPGKESTESQEIYEAEMVCSICLEEMGAGQVIVKTRCGTGSKQ